jgi:WhiB family redox-sensing transcriptional regulator
MKEVTSAMSMTLDIVLALGMADDLDVSTPCRSYDPDLWFAETPDQVALAQELCGGCALRAACLAGALERREPWGVWGGELFERGRVVARKRRPGRPRKDDALVRRAAEEALAARLAEISGEIKAFAEDCDLDGDLLDGELLDVCAVPAQRGGAAA